MTEGDTMETLKRRRANYKGQVTSFNKYIERIAASTSPLSPVEVGELQLRINTFESLLCKYDDVQTEIECAADDVEAQSNEREEFENSYYKALAVANNLLAEFGKLLKLDFKSVAGSECGNKQNLVKLPTIQLPKFNGSYENWLHFRDTFSSLIDSVDNIDDINKFHYLRASLEGAAAVVVQSIEFSAKNYSVAWKLLKERYDNKRLLTNNHVSALFNIEPITRESSLSVKRLIDNLNKNLSALESLGEPVKSWDTLLIYIVVQKLDSKTFREWEGYKGRQSNTESTTLDKFISFLRSHADLLETLEFLRNPPQSQSISAPKGSNPKIKTMVSVQKTDTHETCPKCNGAHPLAKCSRFLALTNEARLKLLPQLKICFNCFSGKHFANRCMKPGCKLCKRKHNVLVHVADYKYTSGTSNADSSTSRSDNETKSGTAPHNAAPSNPDVVFSASATSSAHGGCRQVLLSTALVKLYDNEHREHLARALLDNGSTGCLLTEGMLKKKISDVIIHDFYVDDLLTSIDDFSSALEIRDKVSAELASAKMNLRKLKSNDPRLVSGLDDSVVNLDIGNDLPCKTLGLLWNAKEDELMFPIKGPLSNANTKRSILSTISQVFDPLGLLSPCIISLKMILQKLWLEKLEWDDQLPSQISHEWATIIKNLPVLNEVRMPRCVTCDCHKKLDIHIFVDASERAYGSCVYVRSINDKGEVSVKLLIAKSRVAPLKPTTIPRLELCAALVGTRLYEKVINSLRTPIDKITFWSDSMIVLAWLKMLPNKLQPFVRNRVAEIFDKAVKDSKQLTFMYLANDVIQNSKKKGPEYGKEFGEVLVDSFKHMAKTGINAKTKHSLHRILNIWQERGVYDAQKIQEFKEAGKNCLFFWFYVYCSR
ncbi:pao retrotransposon peptidase domain-containing protein [Phthorimaea operculella]|nr:pao retrotransposon peptidase domain-containing protein [Phthorimaea operculella]